ncbi:hypothetical protein E2C01_033036 [Portunus trituberculatus]|uniref:Uncharacterized protein n=1 Tax=Portunus trituberculatus TaxID=210409 RepID=A0A5B7F2W4_PORTR|nr:hypothetical protein [Portunus trituberculatus]
MQYLIGTEQEHETRLGTHQQYPWDVIKRSQGHDFPPEASSPRHASSGMLRRPVTDCRSAA